MNMFNHAPFDETQADELARLIAFRNDLEAFFNKACPLPDDIASALVAVTVATEKEIIETPATTETDIATKIRFLADIVQEGGSCVEDEFVSRVCADLNALRQKQRRDVEALCRRAAR